jgi:hypothetical protein
MKGCGGSHLDLGKAKELAKPLDANDEKYLSVGSSLESVNLRYLWESLLGERNPD